MSSSSSSSGTTQPSGQIKTGRRRTEKNVGQTRHGDSSWLRQDLTAASRTPQQVSREVHGLGPLASLFADPTVSEILINGPDAVFVERGGRLEPSPIRFCDEAHLVKVVERMVAQAGRPIDGSRKIVDASLADGSRLNAVFPPLSPQGALVSIRRFAHAPLTAQDLIARKSATPEMLRFLAACVRARLNIVVSGSTGSGRTTLLNILAGFIPDDERIVTLEESRELQLQQPLLTRMETHPAGLGSNGLVQSPNMLEDALRLRPNRIIVGELFGQESLDVLRAINSGREGIMTTIRANNTRNAMDHLMLLVGFAAAELTVSSIQQQVASAIDIVVQTSRLPEGQRKIMQISEVTGGADGQTLKTRDIFSFNKTGVDEEGKTAGHFQPSGMRPACLPKFGATSTDLIALMFE